MIMTTSGRTGAIHLPHGGAFNGETSWGGDGEAHGSTARGRGDHKALKRARTQMRRTRHKLRDVIEHAARAEKLKPAPPAEETPAAPAS